MIINNPITTKVVQNIKVPLPGLDYREKIRSFSDKMFGVRLAFVGIHVAAGVSVTSRLNLPQKTYQILFNFMNPYKNTCFPSSRMPQVFTTFCVQAICFDKSCIFLSAYKQDIPVQEHACCFWLSK